MSMVDKVVLVNTLEQGLDYLHIGAADQNLGLVTIVEALHTQGYRDVELFPNKPYEVTPNGIVEENSFRESLVRSVGDAKNVVFGVSTTTDEYYKFLFVTKVVRELFPNATIVAGGPHFAREVLIDSKGNRYKDPIEIALQEQLADAVVVGHAQPFVDFVVKHDGKLSEVKSPGFYYMSEGKIRGRGKGKYPKVSQLPYVKPYNRLIRTLIHDGCANGCDYCSINKGSFNIAPEIVISTLERVIKEQEIRFLDLSDSNPFKPETFKFYQEIFGYLDGNDATRTIKSSLIDPSLVVDPKQSEELMMFLLRHLFLTCFFGRECITGEVASKIGAKLRGKPKSQEQLDKEREGLRDFISFISQFLEGIIKYETLRGSVCISYIFTPFETEQSVVDTIKEMEMFHKMSSTQLTVDPIFTVLSPYPGTRIRAKYIDHIVDPEDFVKLGVRSNVWSYDLGASVVFLDEALDVLEKLREDYSTSQMIKELKLAAMRGFSGKVKKPKHRRERNFYL